jgi:menaquinol-cytochrome c reductase iron-sulfur subunit
MTGKPSFLYRISGGRFGTPPEPARPVKPGCPGGCSCAGNKNQQPTSSRREFLGWIGVATAGIAAFLAGIPIVGAIFTPPTRSERIWHPVGEVDNFNLDETVRVEFTDPDAVPWAGPAAQNAAWLRRIGDEDFVCFSVYCTHVGCPVSWREGANLFICPCHGGVFDREGDVVAGPPETPLVRLDVRLREGQVEILATPMPVTGRRRT